MTATALATLLDTLLPGDGADWPAAGALGMADTVRRLVSITDNGAQALQQVLHLLPRDFETQTGPDREQALRQIADSAPEAFERVVVAAYSAYYIDPAVRDVIERLTGYPNRPPQPDGFELKPFDERLLKSVRSRAPFWRKVSGE